LNNTVSFYSVIVNRAYPQRHVDEVTPLPSGFRITVVKVMKIREINIWGLASIMLLDKQ